MLPYKWKRMGEIDQMGIALAVLWAVNLVYGNMSRFDNVSPCKAMGEWSGHSTLIHGSPGSTWMNQGHYFMLEG